MKPIDPATRPGLVALTVPSLARSIPFYTSILGLQVHREESKVISLGAPKGETILRLFEEPTARDPGGSTTGLYHFAILFPGRASLAEALRRLVVQKWPIQGASDHLVSEAVYLTDPDGNGIELYRDRPKAEWPYQDGELQMATEALDLRRLLSESQSNQSQASAGTVLGHVHLRVADIPAADQFYTGVLGMDLMVRYGAGASFVSAGGYHHHIGYNTWQSRGAASPPPGSIGLRYFSLQLPNPETLEELVKQVEDAGVKVVPQEDGFLIHDPSENGILVTSR